jgi:signal transduction histidine kinase
LQQQAETAIDAQGRIRGSIAGSGARDEIGALSLSLESILARLAHYNSYLEKMAARLSHELRTPVAVVRSSLDNLRATGISEQGNIYVARADEGIRRLSSLISRMAEASQLESMLVGSEKESCDLARLIAGCVEGYGLAYPTTRFTFDVPTAAIVVEVIPDAMAQLLDKLVQNAVDFAAPETAVAISIVSAGKQVCIRVDNKGQNLAPEITSSLFNSMVSSRSGTESGSHLGLGLYIVRLIAEFHNATVSGYNLPDSSGVRFEVRFML